MKIKKGKESYAPYFFMLKNTNVPINIIANDTTKFNFIKLLFFIIKLFPTVPICIHVC